VQTQQFTMPRCRGHKLSFIEMKNGDFKAYDTFCGVTEKNVTWYCSEKCMNDEPTLKYRKSDEEISND